MAGNQLLAALPSVTLNSGCTVTFDAINPTTGADVSGVTVSLGAVYGVNLNDLGSDSAPAALPLGLTVAQLEGEG